MPSDLIAQLYSAPPDGFVAARDEAVAAAKAAGQVDRAKEIAKLRKPTVAAWVVNLLAIRKPELVDDLVELSEAMRQAQRDLKGDELRDLSTQRRAAVNSLVREAVALATDEDPRNRGKLPVAEVEATLTAAVSDADVAEQVRSGRLIRAASYAGFGEVPRPQLRLVTDDVAEEELEDLEAPEEEEAGDAGGEGAARRRADAAARARERELAAQRRAYTKELATARTAEKRAATDLEKATAAEHDAAAAVGKAEEALAAAERRRAEADAELGQRRLARKAAERAAASARRHVGEVEAALESLESDG